MKFYNSVIFFIQIIKKSSSSESNPGEIKNGATIVNFYKFKKVKIRKLDYIKELFIQVFERVVND